VKKVCAVIVAGGVGTRIGGTTPKQYLKIKEKSILEITISNFVSSGLIHHFIVVAHPDFFTEVKSILDKFDISFSVVESGKERQNSVANGITEAVKISDVVLVHDAARPFVNSSIIKNCIDGLDENKAVVVAVKCRDTVKKTNSKLIVESTEDRSKFYLAQTPQGFTKETAEQVLFEINNSSEIGTDDVYFAEKLGIPVKIIEGSTFNFKITTPEDLMLAESLVGKYGYSIA